MSTWTRLFCARSFGKADGHEVVKRFRVTNNLPGAQSAAATMAQTATQGGYSHVEIGWEATGLLWVPFHRLLSTSPLLQPFQPDLICFNPKLVADDCDPLSRQQNQLIEVALSGSSPGLVIGIVMRHGIIAILTHSGAGGKWRRAQRHIIL